MKTVAKKPNFQARLYDTHVALCNGLNQQPLQPEGVGGLVNRELRCIKSPGKKTGFVPGSLYTVHVQMFSDGRLCVYRPIGSEGYAVFNTVEDVLSHFSR